ncbi:MAG: hypothetical protein EA402_14760 [Planctomycetota bacterium]|nr:MAG: hypothetical protein EA402_14760 [Planctomycetota bacterium]
MKWMTRNPLVITAVAAMLLGSGLIFVRQWDVRSQRDPVLQMERARWISMSSDQRLALVTKALDDIGPHSQDGHIARFLAQERILEESGWSVEPAVLRVGLRTWLSWRLQQPRLPLGILYALFDRIPPEGDKEWLGEVQTFEELLAPFHAAVDSFTQDFITLWDGSRVQSDVLYLRFSQLIASSGRSFNPVNDRHLQATMQSIGQWLESRYELQEKLTRQQDLHPREMALLRGALSDEWYRALTWWLRLSFIPQQSLWQSQSIDDPLKITARRMLYRPTRAPTVWLALTWLLFVMLSAQIIWWMRRGLRPVDPMAETLENIDPVDLDTEAVTLSRPGWSTDQGTTDHGINDPDELPDRDGQDPR